MVSGFPIPTPNPPAPDEGGGGGGAVDSVNGQTGAVVVAEANEANVRAAGGVISADVTDIVQVTQAAYDALTPDPNTLYVIVG